MADLHPLLKRQLRRAQASDDAEPSFAAWQDVLAAVSGAYRDADEGRYMIERSLELASAELAETNATVAKERDRLERELDSARVLQTSFLPRATLRSFLEVSTRMQPATEVGGDYYDILEAPDACWIGIGDVTGHGLRAALIMLMVQSMVAALVRAYPDGAPAELLARVNDGVWNGLRKRLGVDDHVTCTLLRCGRDGHVEYAGAHEEILLCRASARECERLATPGTWLGVTANVESLNPQCEFQLAAGDLVVLYTDGVIEAMNASREEYGIDRLAAAIARYRDGELADISEQLFRDVNAWCPSHRDDVSLVLLRYRGSDSC